jgi:uncharacterized protein (TIGR00369 family)
MTPAASAHPELHARIEASFVRQGMMQHLGARIVSVAPGEVEIALPYSERVTQQQGGYHGGAMGALADIAAGYAGLTFAPEGQEVTTVEYKINFLAASKVASYAHAAMWCVRANDSSSPPPKWCTSTTTAANRPAL